MSIETLIKSVQFNCDLSDREFAADYSICIYLIRMREYYRWAHQIAADQPLKQQDLLAWVSLTEQRWQGLEANDYKPLVFAGQQYSPFDADNLNQKLHPLGYTYSAGYGRLGKPVFMLAKLDSIEYHDDYTLLIAGKELARELSAPPAIMQTNTILIRRESVARLIWDLLEEWQWHKPDNAMAQLVDYYGFEARPMQALERASEDQQEVLILHEIGELLAGQMVAPVWNSMLNQPHKQAHFHLFARAVRDNLADCLTTLPGLLAEDNTAGLLFYFASLTPLRKSLFPSLANSYQTWRNDGTIVDIQSAIKSGQSHWLKIANSLTDGFSQSAIKKQQTANKTLQTYIEQYAL